MDVVASGVNSRGRSTPSGCFRLQPCLVSEPQGVSESASQLATAEHIPTPGLLQIQVDLEIMFLDNLISQVDNTMAAFTVLEQAEEGECSFLASR